MRPRLPVITAFAAAALLVLAGCAPKPIYRASPDLVQATPAQVARTPEPFSRGQVIWGGRIVAVTNRTDHTEIEMLGYPLDKSQRPQPRDATGGRFIAIVPGYLEPLNYPPGSLMTLSGHLQGTRSGKVGEAAYAFPLVAVDDYHLWTAEELRSPWSNVHVGVGVGIR